MGAAVLISLSLAMSGCAASDDTADDEPVVPGTSVVDDDDETSVDDESAPTKSAALAAITSCDQVAAAVEPYIQNLTLHQDSIVDEWGVYCNWEAPEGNTDFANIRNVEVLLEPDPLDKPDLDALSEFIELQPIENGWVSGQGGVAYSVGTETAVAAVINTTVWLPDVEASITGGRWGDYPALDGPAAVEVVEALLD